MKPKIDIRLLPTHVILLISCIVIFFPLVWMLSTSFKEASEVFTHEIRLIPRAPTLANYIYVWKSTPFLRWLLNSAITALGITLCQIITSLFAAYAFGYYDFFGKKFLFLTFVGSMIIPFAVIMIPNYIIIAKMKLQNTWWAVILPYSVNGFGIFLLRQYILTFPKELFDASKLDGANSWITLWRILAPVIKAPVFALSIVFFLDAWNMYFWPLLVLTENTTRTFSIGLQYFVDFEEGQDWGAFMAASTMGAFPALAAYIVAQKQIIRVYITSGLK